MMKSGCKPLCCASLAMLRTAADLPQPGRPKMNTIIANVMFPPTKSYIFDQKKHSKGDPQKVIVGLNIIQYIPNPNKCMYLQPFGLLPFDLSYMSVPNLCKQMYRELLEHRRRPGYIRPTF